MKALLATLGLLSALVPATAPAQTQTPPATGTGLLRLVGRADMFLHAWLQVQHGGDATAFAALYTPDYTVSSRVGRKVLTVPRPQWMKEQADAIAGKRRLVVSDATLQGSSKRLELSFNVQWQEGKRRGQGRRTLTLVEQNGALRVSRDTAIVVSRDAAAGDSKPGPPLPETLAPPPSPLYICPPTNCYGVDPEQKAEVLALCTESCAKDATACGGLGTIHASGACGAPQDSDRALAAWERACQSPKKGDACERAADFLASRKGDGDNRRALTLLGCDAPRPLPSCSSLLAAQLLAASGDAQKAQRSLQLYVKACGTGDSETGDPEACRSASVICKQGLTGTPDPQRAEELDARAGALERAAEKRAVEDPRVNRHGDI